MENKNMTRASIVIFILSLLVFVATVFLVFFKPSMDAKKNTIDYSNTENIEVGDVSTQIGNSGRYFKGYVYLQVAGKKTPKNAEERMPQLKDSVLDAISGSDVDDVTGDMSKIKERIKKGTDSVLGKGTVIDVFFTEYIVQ